VTAETPETLIQALPTDRRPAIWPWLVMPLITLILFYWLYSLDQVAGMRAYGSAATATGAHAESESVSP
jgi:hypothetical protein